MLYSPSLRPEQIEALYHLRVELHCPMTRLVRHAVDLFLGEMGRKKQQACRAGTPLSDWLDYERDMEEADAAAKQVAGLNGVNAPF